LLICFFPFSLLYPPSAAFCPPPRRPAPLPPFLSLVFLPLFPRCTSRPLDRSYSLFLLPLSLQFLYFFSCSPFSPPHPLAPTPPDPFHFSYLPSFVSAHDSTRLTFTPYSVPFHFSRTPNPPFPNSCAPTFRFPTYPFMLPSIFPPPPLTFFFLLSLFPIFSFSSFQYPLTSIYFTVSRFTPPTLVLPPLTLTVLFYSPFHDRTWSLQTSIFSLPNVVFKYRLLLLKFPLPSPPPPTSSLALYDLVIVLLPCNFVAFFVSALLLVFTLLFSPLVSFSSSGNLSFFFVVFHVPPADRLRFSCFLSSVSPFPVLVPSLFLFFGFPIPPI